MTFLVGHDSFQVLIHHLNTDFGQVRLQSLTSGIRMILFPISKLQRGPIIPFEFKIGFSRGFIIIETPPHLLFLPLKSNPQIVHDFELPGKDFSQETFLLL